MKRWFAISIFLCFLITPQAQEEIQSEAFVFLGLMTKAQHGDPEGQYQVGRCFYDGTFGMDQDYAVAIKWFEKAAAQNHTGAIHALGLCYGLGKGVEHDYVKAADYFRHAIALNHVPSLHALGLFYYAGKGVEQSNMMAYRYILDAANHDFEISRKFLNEHQLVTLEELIKDRRSGSLSDGHLAFMAELGAPEYQCLMGMIYDGMDKEEDYKIAVTWYQKAAAQGYAPAINNLGYCYFYGHGVEKNQVKAFEYYFTAATKGNPLAQKNCGEMLFFGDGVKRDLNAAKQWFEKAALQNNASAQYYLGVCYDSGYGVKKNEEEALRWYNKAASQGQKNAIERLKSAKPAK